MTHLAPTALAPMVQRYVFIPGTSARRGWCRSRREPSVRKYFPLLSPMLLVTLLVGCGNAASASDAGGQSGSSGGSGHGGSSGGSSSGSSGGSSSGPSGGSTGSSGGSSSGSNGGSSGGSSSGSGGGSGGSSGGSCRDSGSDASCTNPEPPGSCTLEFQDGGTPPAGSSCTNDSDCTAGFNGRCNFNYTQMSAPCYCTYATQDGGAQEAACLAAGGAPTPQLCCAGTSDFPPICSADNEYPCSCPPVSTSSYVTVCWCPTGMCFDGSQCVQGL
jgi:hypothetical protein